MARKELAQRRVAGVAFPRLARTADMLRFTRSNLSSRTMLMERAISIFTIERLEIRSVFRLPTPESRSPLNQQETQIALPVRMLPMLRGSAQTGASLHLIALPLISHLTITGITLIRLIPMSFSAIAGMRWELDRLMPGALPNPRPFRAGPLFREQKSPKPTTHLTTPLQARPT